VAKNLIIGGFTNYNANQLRPWVLSAKVHSGDDNDCDVVLVYGNASDETLDWLESQGVILVPMLPVQNVPIHVLRFLSIHNYLVQHWQKYDYVITTDVKDVYFQTDPFLIFKHPYYQDNNLKLVIASEGLKYKDEAWGNENLYQTYGQYVYEEFKNNEIFNVGTFGGHSEYVKDMVFNIFTNATNRPIPICDQAVFNVLINTVPYKDIVFYTHDWACELGTVMDPSKIEKFRPNLLFSEPIWENGLVKIPPLAGRIFPIVHQYDRVPEIKKFVEKKFGQDDESQMFIYRS
jgi:hypothetical protein